MSSTPVMPLRLHMSKQVHQFRHVHDRIAFGVETMVSIVRFGKIMGEFVATDHKPIRVAFTTVTVTVRKMKRLEVPKVEVESASGIECNCCAGGIVIFLKTLRKTSW